MARRKAPTPTVGKDQQTAPTTPTPTTPTPTTPTPTKTTMATTKEGPTLVAATPAELAKSNGTIHVRVLRTHNLTTMDYGRRQEPVVQVELQGSSPRQYGSTDPASVGGTEAEWAEYQNRDVELFYDAALLAHKAHLTIEVYTDDSQDQLIGTGQIDVTKIVTSKTEAPTEYTVSLKESLKNKGASRGDVQVQVWFGPPVRKAFRAAARVHKLLDARDKVVGSVWSLGLSAGAPFAKYVAWPTEFLKKNRKISVALAALLGVLSAGATALFLLIAVPTAIFAAFTFPFWIIPFLLVAFFTAPLWIPVVLLVGVFLAFIGAFCVGLGVTSRPVRRKGAQISNAIKHSDVGKRVVYEKTE